MVCRVPRIGRTRRGRPTSTTSTTRTPRSGSWYVPRTSAAVANSDQLRVVASGPGGIELLAPSAAHHVHRALVEEDFRLFRDGTRDGDANVRLALAAAGALGEAPHAICPPGTFAALTRRRPSAGRRFSCTPPSAGVFPRRRRGAHRAPRARPRRRGQRAGDVRVVREPSRVPGLGVRARRERAGAQAARPRKRGARRRARALACAPWWTLSRRAGVALALADVAGLRDAVLLNEWGAAQFRDMLDTGGGGAQACGRGDARRRGGAAGAFAAAMDQSSADEALANDAPFAPASAFEKKAGALMDADGARRAGGREGGDRAVLGRGARAVAEQYERQGSRRTPRSLGA